MKTARLVYEDREEATAFSVASQDLYNTGDGYILVSTVDTLDCGPESMAFKADQEGTVLDWMELAVNRPPTPSADMIRDLGYTIKE